MAHVAMSYEPRSAEGSLTSASAPLLLVQGLSVRFGGQVVLDQATFDLQRGTITAITGENGAGKTTVLNAIQGLVRPSAGSIVLAFGSPPRSVELTRTAPERIARLGVGRLWQDIRLFPTLSVLENVVLAHPSVVGGPWDWARDFWPLSLRVERNARARALEYLERVGLADRANSTCNRLSVGQMKRVALARLLEMEAGLLLLDEPLAGLDRPSRAGLLSLLEGLAGDHAKTLLIVEHDLPAVRSIATETLHIAEGRMGAVRT
jgi:ABC-type branched-subunit amino acid transport system ATPase component